MPRDAARGSAGVGGFSRCERDQAGIDRGDGIPRVDVRLQSRAIRNGASRLRFMGYGLQKRTRQLIPIYIVRQSQLVRALQGFRELVMVVGARDFNGAELGQMIRLKLRVKQREPTMTQQGDKIDKRQLACVGAAAEHAFAEKRAS